MKLSQTLALAASAVLVLGVSGCSKDDDSNSNDSGSGTLSLSPKTISTPEEAQNAVAVSTSGGFGGSNKSAQLSKSFVRKAMAAKAPQTVPCDVSGEIVVTVDEANHSSTTEYKNCKEDGELTNGIVKYNGTKYTFTDFTVKDLNTSEESVLNVSYVTSKSGEFDVMTIDGGMVFTDNKGRSEVGYEKFEFANNENAHQFKIDKKLSVQSDEKPCVNGGYVYTTNQVLVEGQNGISSGELDINGVKYTFSIDNNSKGIVTVDFGNGKTAIINQDEEVICK